MGRGAGGVTRQSTRGLHIFFMTDVSIVDVTMSLSLYMH